MHAASCTVSLYPLFEKNTILEARPCLRLELNFIKGKLFHYVGSDGIFIVSPGELLHPGYDEF